MTTTEDTETATTVRVGDFFTCSWGYDQTNVDFYKVLEVTKSGKSVKVQQWSQASDGDRVLPGDGPAEYPQWVDGQCVGSQPEPITTRRLNTSYGLVRITVPGREYDHAQVWDGRSKYQTAAGCGH